MAAAFLRQSEAKGTAQYMQLTSNENHERQAALLQLARAVRETGYSFVTVTPATHARVNSRPGNQTAASIEDIFGWSRPFDAEVLPPALFALMQAAGVAVRDGDRWRSLIRLSTLHGQLFIHSAYPTTDTHAVFFGPDTYRFVAALAHHLDARSSPVRRAVDIGCGAGPGAIVMALERPAAQVLAVDINAAALQLTQANAALAGTGNVITVHSNLLSAVEGEFDLIIANPPYLLDPAERAYRHGGGGFGEGLSIAIVGAALDRLAPGGSLLLYTGAAIIDGCDHFRATVAAQLDVAGVQWNYREIDPDVFGEELLEPAYARADRIAAVLLTVTRSAAGS